MGSEETRTDASRSGSTETTNVVRIPRDWFGPKEELVPFGPRAWEDAAETDADNPGTNAKPQVPPDPDAFWGEDADSIHDVLDAAPSAETRSRPPTLAAAAIVFVIASAGLATWLLGSSKPRSFHPPVTSISADQHSAATRLLATRAARTSRPHPLVHRPLRSGRRAASATRATQVVYHPNQVTTPATGGASASTATGSSSSEPTTAVASTASPPPSQPAFGSNGALGPMSSPNG